MPRTLRQQASARASSSKETLDRRPSKQRGTTSDDGALDAAGSRPQRKRKAPEMFEVRIEADSPRTRLASSQGKTKTNSKHSQRFGKAASSQKAKTAKKAEKATSKNGLVQRRTASKRAPLRLYNGELDTSEVDELATISAGSDAEMTPDRILSPSDEEWFVAHYKPGCFDELGKQAADWDVWVEVPAITELPPLSEIANKPQESAKSYKVNGKRKECVDLPVGARPLEKGLAPAGSLMQSALEHSDATAQDVVATVADEQREASPLNSRDESITRSAPSMVRTELQDNAASGRESECAAAESAVPAKPSIFRNFRADQLFRGGSDGDGDDDSSRHHSQSPAKQAVTSSGRESTSHSMAKPTTLSVQDSEEAMKLKRQANKKRKAAGRQRKREARIEKKRLKKQKRENRAKAETQERRRKHSDDDDDDDKDDLRQDLNVDAYVKSRSEKEAIKQRRQRLKQLRQANKKRTRTVESDSDSDAADDEDASDSDDSGTSSDSDSSSVDSSSSSAFVVEDDDEPVGQARGNGQMHKGAKAQSFARFDVHHNGMPDLPPARLTLLEKCDEYLKWLLVLALDLESSVPKDRIRTLGRVRADLRQELRMEYTQLTSQSTRRQFRWYLTHYPYFEKREMNKEEIKVHRGCAACTRASQQCEFAFSFWGRFYNADTLEWRDDESDTESDISTDRQDERIAEHNDAGEDVHTFFLGGTCAQKAAIMHRLLHWERRALRDVTRLPSFKALRKRARNANGKGDVVRPQEIERVALEHRTVLMRYIRRLKKGADDARMRNAYVHRGHEKWDDAI